MHKLKLDNIILAQPKINKYETNTRIRTTDRVWNYNLGTHRIPTTSHDFFGDSRINAAIDPGCHERNRMDSIKFLQNTNKYERNRKQNKRY